MPRGGRKSLATHHSVTVISPEDFGRSPEDFGHSPDIIVLHAIALSPDVR